MWGHRLLKAHLQTAVSYDYKQNLFCSFRDFPEERALRNRGEQEGKGFLPTVRALCHRIQLTHEEISVGPSATTEDDQE